MRLAACLVFAVVLANGAAVLPVEGSGSTPSSRSFSVVAIVDTGIRPNLAVYNDTTLNAHPSTYVTGYPSSALPLDKLATGAVRNQLYYVPGTRVVGAISLGEHTSALSCANSAQTPVWDDCGHGSGVSAIAAAQSPNVLIVHVEVSSPTQGVAWALEQPWIDVISISWGTIANAPVPGMDSLTREATARGKIVVVAAGNGVTNTALLPDRSLTYTSPFSGPSWVIAVGAVNDDTQRDYYWHSIPVDVAAPSPRGGGTSYAAPVVSGQAGRLVASARAAVGDTSEGPKGAILAQGAPAGSGPLADGALTRDELAAALLRTAAHTPADSQGRDVPLARDFYECMRLALRDGNGYAGSWACQSPVGATGVALPPWPGGTVPVEPDGTQPPTPLDFLFEGYGIVNGASGDRAWRVLLGLDASPDRVAEDAFRGASLAIRDAVWKRDVPRPGLHPCDVPSPLWECCGDPDDPKLCWRP
ncbi:MAG TPA: S8/S53 family peptidase [Candidatus Thermoplasmatota archaeon]|nr:S8/S53 family peptidase [Candidatus Thermoplasmatota archaeon]